MAFENFINKPTNEHELFMQLANEVKNNFITHHKQYYYFHISDVDGQKSQIDYVQDLRKLEDHIHYVYIERDKQACILLRSDENSISMLLYGERDSGHLKITPKEVVELGNRAKSTLPARRRSKMTAIEIRQAFGFMEDSLHDFRRKKAS
jgi:hypothetical protein